MYTKHDQATAIDILNRVFKALDADLDGEYRTIFHGNQQDVEMRHAAIRVTGTIMNLMSQVEKEGR